MSNTPQHISSLLLHWALTHFVKRDGLEVAYPDGTIVGYGDNPQNLRLTIYKTRTVRRVLVSPLLAIGEAYMHGRVDITQPGKTKCVPAIKRFIEIMACNIDTTRSLHRAYWRFRTLANGLLHEDNAPEKHYDMGNELYKLMLDDTLTYSCAYWGERPASMSLEQAQARKIENILAKLELKPAQRLLDIGSGWGHLVMAAVQKHNVHAVGTTVSREQLKKSQQLARRRRLTKQAQFKLVDYRELLKDPHSRAAYDAIASVGMFEHVGRTNHQTYFAALKHLIKPGGRVLLHTITIRQERPINPWIRKYIFPGGYLPTQAKVVELARRSGFRDLDIQTMRRHYALTLDAWGKHLEQNEVSVKRLFKARKITHPLVKDADTFFRMMCFYLGVSSGGFAQGPLEVAQFRFTNGINNSNALTRKHML